MRRIDKGRLLNSTDANGVAGSWLDWLGGAANVDAWMPRYFFHIRKSGLLEEAPQAVALPEGSSLAKEAIELARDLLAEGDLAGLDRQDWVFEVADESGQPVLMFYFACARTGSARG